MLKNNLIKIKYFFCDLSYKYNLMKLCNEPILFFNNPKNLTNYIKVHNNLFRIFKVLRDISINEECKQYVNNKLIDNNYKLFFEKINPNLNNIIKNIEKEINLLKNNLDNIKIEQDIYNITKCLKSYLYFENYINDKILFLHKEIIDIYINYLNNDIIGDYFTLGMNTLLNNIQIIEYYLKNNKNLDKFKIFEEKVEKLINLILNKNIFLLKLNGCSNNLINRYKSNLNGSLLTNLIKQVLIEYIKKVTISINEHKCINQINDCIDSFAILNYNNYFIKDMTYNKINIYGLLKNLFFNNIANIMLKENLKISLRYINNLIFNISFDSYENKEIQKLKNIYNKYLDLYLNNEIENDDKFFALYLKSGINKNFIEFNKLKSIYKKLDEIINYNLIHRKNDTSYFKTNILFWEFYKINIKDIKYNINSFKKIFWFYLNNKNKLFSNYTDSLFKILDNLNFNNDFTEINEKFSLRIQNEIITNKSNYSIDSQINYFKFWSLHLKEFDVKFINSIINNFKISKINNLNIIEKVKFVFILERSSSKINKENIDMINNFTTLVVEELEKICFKKLFFTNYNSLFIFTKKINNLIIFMNSNITKLEYVNYNKSIKIKFIDKMYKTINDLFEDNYFNENLNNKNLDLILKIIFSISKLRKTVFQLNKYQIKICESLLNKIFEKNIIDNIFFNLFNNMINLNLTIESYNKFLKKLNSLLIEGKFEYSSLLNIASIVYGFPLKDNNEIFEKIDKIIYNNLNLKLESFDNISVFMKITINIIYRNNNQKMIEYILQEILNNLFKLNYSKSTNQKINLFFISKYNIFTKNLIFLIKNKFSNIAETEIFKKLESEFNTLMQNLKIDFESILPYNTIYNSVFQNEVHHFLKTSKIRFECEQVVDNFSIDFKLDNDKLIEVIGSVHFLGNTNLKSIMLDFKVDILRYKKYRVIELYSTEFYSPNINKNRYILDKINN